MKTILALALFCLTTSCPAQALPAFVANWHPYGETTPPDLVFSDFSVQDQVVDASTNVVVSGPTHTLSYTNDADAIGYFGDGYATFTMRFQCTGSPSSITNWSHWIKGGNVYAGYAEIRVKLDAYTTGYATGSHVIAEDYTPLNFGGANDGTSEWPLGSGTITPNAHLWFTVTIIARLYDANDFGVIAAYTLTLNSP